MIINNNTARISAHSPHKPHSPHGSRNTGKTRKSAFLYHCGLKDGSLITLSDFAEVKARKDVVTCRIEPAPRKKTGTRAHTKIITPGFTGKFFRCLCVKSPYARRIVTGEKLEEYRTRPTRIRGRIGIIESGTGTIIGDVELFDCTERSDWDYVWHLRNARAYAVPVKYQHPFGAVVWVKVPCQ